MGIQAKRLHLGCGPTVIDGWLNIDGSWSAWFARHQRIARLLGSLRLVPKRLVTNFYPGSIVMHDLRKPLTFVPDGTCEAVYASHVLEHMLFPDAQQVLRESFRVLEPGGVARFVVPDLRAIVREYLGEGTVADAHGEIPDLQGADRFSARFLNASTARQDGSVFYRTYTALTNFHLHKWMYDGASLARHMTAAGFVDVRQRDLHDSEIAGIDAIEAPERVAGGNGVCVEGRKPQL
jgi:predicted SAM-dependent methyltransferase